MKHRFIRVGALTTLALLFSGAATRADYAYRDANNSIQTFSAWTISGKILPISSAVDANGLTIYGAAGAPNADVLTFQGISGGFPLPVSMTDEPGTPATGVTQPTGGAGMSGWLSGIYKAVTGALTVTPSASAAAGGIPSTCRTVSAGASTNATSCKTSAGRVYGFSACNETTATRFVKLYNKASSPTVGTDTPIMTFPVKAQQCFAKDWSGIGYGFSTGIAYAFTVNSADSDTTALSAGDLDGFNLDYN